MAKKKRPDAKRPPAPAPGFPKFLVEASERLRERGLADVEPPPDAVERTVAACEPALRALNVTTKRPKGRRG